MDRVRFGRALGFGARQALKTLVRAADAASAEPPAKPPARAAGTRLPAQPADPPAVPRPAARAPINQLKTTRRGLGQGTRRFGEAVWNPFVRLSGVLWLEVTGVFFGIFALFALGAAWRLRGSWHQTPENAAAHRSLVGAALMLIVFGYFTVSSFVRAKRRERRR